MYLLIFLAAGWVAGLWAAAQLPWPGWGWLLLALASAGAGVGLWRRPRARLGLAVAFTVALGGWRYQLAQPVFDATALAQYNDWGTVALEGVVWDEPDRRDTQTLLRVRVDTLLLAGSVTPQPVHGLALVYAPRFSETRLAAAGDSEFQYGDRVYITGQLETPPEFDSFSYRDYLARQGIYTQVRLAKVLYLAGRQGQPLAQFLFDFKTRAEQVLRQIFPEPHAALLTGILLGVDSGIPQELKDAFSLTGTSHIVAISGFNIAIIAGIFAAGANRLFGERRGAWVAIGGIVVYTVLVGASASVVRAAIMGGLAIVGRRLGRGGSGLHLLAAAVILMTLFNPFTLWDVGFQLSVMATLGLVLYADRLQKFFERQLARFLSAGRAQQAAALAGELFLVTLAAQITTLPLMIYYFQSLSIISLAANMVILPVQPAVMLVGGVALILGLVAAPLGQLAAMATWPFTAYTLAFVTLFARVPLAALPLDETAPWVVALFYAALFGWTWLTSLPLEQRPAWSAALLSAGLPKAGLAALAVGVVMVWSAYFSLPDGRLKITLLAVGQGDAILIQTPGGAQVLVDGGPSGGALARALARELPLFDRDIDLLVIAAPRDENLGGLPDLLARYHVRQVVLTGAVGTGGTYRTVMEALIDQPLEPVPASGRPVFDLGDGARLRVLADGKNGSALRLEWQRFSLLLPVGLTTADETALLMHGVQPATALLLADSGANTATQPNWVWTVDPRVVLVSTDAGHPPAPEVLERLAGRTVLRTDLQGDLTLFSDGERLWVETAR